MENKDYAHLPTLSEVLKGIAGYKKLNLTDKDFSNDFNETIKFLDGVFKTHNLYFVTRYLFVSSQENDPSLKMYRAREFSTIENMNLICEYSYLPLHLCINVQ